MSRDQHAYRLFQSALRSDAFPRTVLLCGPEDYLVRWATGEMESAWIHPASAALDLIVFSEGQASAQDIISACETLPVFSAKRIVIVDDCDCFSASKRRLFDADGCDLLADYFEVVPESTLLVFRRTDIDKRTKIYRSLRKNGMVFEFSPVSNPVVRGFVQKQLRASQKTASPETIRRMVERVGYGDAQSGYTLSHLMNDLTKAIAHSESEMLSYEDFEAVTAADVQSNVFQLLESAFRGDRKTALLLWKRQLGGTQSSAGSREIFGFIALLCAQLEMMLCAKERLVEGQSVHSLPKAMGVHPYRMRKALEAAGNRSSERLASDLREAYRLENHIKSGRMPADVAVELFIASV